MNKGTGQNFQRMTVTQNVSGFRGLSFGNGATPQPLNVQMPANLQCTGTVGGMNNVCMVRCQNQALAGPFGGCVPVQQASAGANVNANAGAAAPAPAADTGNTGGNGGGAGGIGGLLGNLGGGAGAGGNGGGLRGFLSGLRGNNRRRSAEAQVKDEDGVVRSEKELEGLDDLDLEWARERLATLKEGGDKKKRAVMFRS